MENSFLIAISTLVAMLKRVSYVIDRRSLPIAQEVHMWFGDGELNVEAIRLEDSVRVRCTKKIETVGRAGFVVNMFQLVKSLVKKKTGDVKVAMKRGKLHHGSDSDFAIFSYGNSEVTLRTLDEADFPVTGQNRGKMLAGFTPRRRSDR